MENGEPTNQNSGNETLSYGRYRVLQRLGEGAMGRVYLSEDPILKRQVAVKVIPTDRHLDPAVLSEYLERFTVEAQACARLNHPSIVSIYDAGEQDGVPWIAFEYVSGEHLDRLIGRQKQLPFSQIARIAGDIAAAMRHAHSLNIVHRDVKPANILIDDKSGVAKLADFGIVKSPFTTITQSGTAVGSPGYMSPEQIDDLEVDARSDLFSFGIVLYEMITGAHPFLRDSVQSTFLATLNCSYAPIAKLRDDAPEKLVKIVEKSLVADRNLRIIDADELCSMIAGCLDDESRKTRLTRAKETKRTVVKRLKFTYALALRRARLLLKSVPPFCKKTLNGAAALCKRTYAKFIGWSGEKVVPPVKNAAGRIYAPIGKRFTKAQVTAALTAATSLAATVVLLLVILSAGAKSGDRRALVDAAQRKGYAVKNGRQLLDTCRGYIDRCDYWNAGELADILATAKDKSYVLRGSLYRAMAALCADRFDEASALFLETRKLDGGAAAVRREHPFYIKYLEAWIERELPEALVDLCAQRLELHESQQVRAWAKDEHYWIRWNAVYILRKGGEKVDLVQAYILDLDHSASARTKIRAAERLGELGDRRAVPALMAARDGKGPAASTARRVLREKFNVW